MTEYEEERGGRREGQSWQSLRRREEGGEKEKEKDRGEEEKEEEEEDDLRWLARQPAHYGPE